MLPNTAKNLDVKKTNKLKDFLGVASPLGKYNILYSIFSLIYIFSDNSLYIFIFIFHNFFFFYFFPFSKIGITHFIVATSSNVGSHLRFMRVPRGPTLTFRIHSYSLVNDIISVRRRPLTPSETAYMNPPLMVLNNFTDTTRKEIALMAVAFQNMFPVINVGKVSLIIFNISIINII